MSRITKRLTIVCSKSVMPEVLSRASKGSKTLDSRQRTAGMTADEHLFCYGAIKKHVEPLDKYFGVRKGFDLETYMATCWKKYSLGEPEEITIRFSANVAAEIKRKKWHPKQRISENPDDSIDLLVELAGHEEVLRWVLSWGRDAEIVSPPDLRKAYYDEVKQMARSGKKHGTV